LGTASRNGISSGEVRAVEFFASIWKLWSAGTPLWVLRKLGERKVPETN
jgi:hypothetical protein